MINIQEFINEFNKQYDFIYEANRKGSYVAGTDEAVEYFDNHRTEEENQMLKEFVLARGDFVSSDREAVAFMFTVDKFMQ